MDELAELLSPKHKFKPGQRVRPSGYGIKRNIFPKTQHEQTGTVVKVDVFGSPTVLWKGRKQAKGYFSGFIAPDRRRKTKKLRR